MNLSEQIQAVEDRIVRLLSTYVFFYKFFDYSRNCNLLKIF